MDSSLTKKKHTGKNPGGLLWKSMKTTPPARSILRIKRSHTLLLIACICIFLAAKRREHVTRLVFDAARKLAQEQTFTENQVPSADQVALVPGTSIRGERLRERVETAARLLHAGIVSHLILSGDGRNPNYHEPHAMRQMLRELGIADRFMTEDPAGLSTYESVQRAGQIAAGRPLVIVTQELYCGRSLLLARGLGVKAIACAIPSDSPQASMKREELACVRALIDLAGLRQWTESWEQRRNAHLTSDHSASVQG